MKRNRYPYGKTKETLKDRSLLLKVAKRCECLHCMCCGHAIHAFNNEAMDIWVETKSGPICDNCYSEMHLKELGL